MNESVGAMLHHVNVFNETGSHTGADVQEAVGPTSKNWTSPLPIDSVTQTSGTAGRDDLLPE